MRPDPCIQTIPLRPEDLDEVREADVATRQVDREELARRLASPADLPRVPSPPPIPTRLLTAPTIIPLAPSAPTSPPPATTSSPRRFRKLVVAAVLGLAIGTVVFARVSDRPSAPAAVELRPSPLPAPVVAPDPVEELVAHARTLIANGDRDRALDLVLRSRTTYSQDARLAALAGRLYFEKLWWADGVKQLRAAFALQPSLRSDPDLAALAVNAYITTPTYSALLGRFVREDVGAAALPALEEIARTHRNQTIRRRAAAEIRRIASH